jgi:hypothetical protein
MASAVERHDPAAHGVAEDHGPIDLQRVAERRDVVGALLEGPGIDVLA